MPVYGMIIDVSKCTGCYNCFLACKDEYCGNDYPGYSASQPATGHYWMRLVEKERGAYPKVKVPYRHHDAGPYHHFLHYGAGGEM